MNSVSKPINTLSLDQKRALLVELLKKRADESEFPSVSYIERSLWFLYQLAPESAAYNVVFAARVISDVDIPALKRAFQGLVDRHSALRTSYFSNNGRPVRHVHEYQEVNFREVDASAWNREDLNKRLLAEAHWPFKLEEDPLLRVVIFSQSVIGNVFLFVIHHIAIDFWSLVVLMDDLSVLYPAERQGLQHSLPPSPSEYSDYIRWQKELLSSQEGERLWLYWRDQLTGKLPVLQLPTDRARPSVQTYRGSSFPFSLNENLTKALRLLAKDSGVTLYTVLLTAYKVLLYRYTTQEDILVGSPMAGRSRAAFAGIVGSFTSLATLRTNLSGNPTFRALLHQVHKTVLGALEHQDYPAALLVERLQPIRDPSHSPLFQAVFTLNKPHREELAGFVLDGTGVRFEFGDLVLESLALEHRVAMFELLLLVYEVGEKLSASLQGNSDLFDEATIGRMAGHLQTLLEGIVARPDQKISMLPLLTAREHQQLFEWNTTRRDYPQELCLHQLFEAQVERTPDAIALVFEDQQLTYAELNQRANQVTRYLRSLGVGPEVLVGICLERSIEMVVSLLAILKAGGAYVPLDPTYPKDRLAFMLHDTCAPLLLTQTQLLSLLPQHTARVVCLDRDWQVISSQETRSITSEVTTENLAYVIYTSGSTGDPKGVQVSHGNVTRLFESTRAWLQFSPADVWTLFHSYAFDFSVWELWGALLYGGRLVVVPYRISRSPVEFYDLLRTAHVTVLNQTPSAFRQIVRVEQTLGLAKDLSLRLVVFGGEALELQSLKPWFDSHGNQGPRLINMYGITETTVHVTYRPLEISDMHTASSSVIGEHIPDLEIYLLDKYLQPVPIGVPGELYVGGAGLARGYLGRPDLTAERFIPNPFGTKPGARLYWTGDLARYLPDGDIEYLGRIDHQVKIRGYRIELGEIEAVLSQHPAVREVIVIVREDLPGGKGLVAYVISQQEANLISSELRSLVKERLPDYMRPSAFMVLEALPLTPNGKVDRHALPLPEGIRPELDSPFVAPRTPVEEVLAGIWAEVLGLERVGIHDNFFDLGGHSLMAIQIISRVRESLQIDLPLQALFEDPTIAGVIQNIEAVHRASRGLRITPINITLRNDDLILSFAQERLWFLDQLMPGSPFYNIPIAIRLTGVLNTLALEQGLNELVERHEVLRTTFVVKDGRPIQEIASELVIPLAFIDLRALPKTEREVQALREGIDMARQPFNLAQGPLLRVVLFQTEDQEHVLFLIMHHIIADGWSIGILVREVAVFYEGTIAGNPIKLPELPIQYADFAQWQRHWLQGEVLDTQLAYWKQHLQAAPATLALPTDRPRPPAQTFRGALHHFTIPSALVEALKRLSRQEATTLFMTLLATFAVLLQRYSGQEEIVVGSPVANRGRPEIEGLIGFFVNTLALCIDLSGSPSFRELLKRTRSVALGAFAHQDLPFEKLVEELQPKRDLSRTPLFQVMFALQNAPLPTLEFSGLVLRPLEIDSGTAKFDLTLLMVEAEGRLLAALEYNSDLFDGATIVRMAGHLQVLLEGIVARPDQKISMLPLMTTRERQQLLVEWNSTGRDYPKELCLHQLFEAQVERTPDAIALVFEDQHLTYSELNERANQLAHYLCSLGVGPEVLVGICLERSVEMVVGLLAILKAGGAYVPLDPTYPKDRLAFMLHDTDAPLLLTQTHLLPLLPQHSARVVCFDRDWHPTEDANRADSNTNTNRSAPENLAYVLYTSGSTGRPKGVIMTHKAMHNLVQWQAVGSTAARGANVLQFSPLSFDVSCQEIFSTWWTGGTLYLPLQEARRNIDALLHYIIENGIERIFLPSIVFQNLAILADNLQQLPERIKDVVVAGEQLQINRYTSHLLGRLNDCKLHNQYGPTESHVVTSFIMTGKDGVWPKNPPIGRPIANTQIHILDKYLQPVPIGVPGELYVGGAGLARGYLGRPDLTAERFIPNPFGTKPGARLYWTGDLARYLPDGDIEYLGRIDHQVKIRGYRIELGEIEAVLSQHPAVREVIVIVREDLPGGKGLVAYVISQQEANLISSELRSLVKERLPDYMRPSAFMVLEALPLTPNGKVDRHALPLPEGIRPELDSPFVAPRTPVEEVLAGIWAEVLGLERVGIHDNFFDLGGHSLMAIQIISRVRESLQIDLPLQALFEDPTIAGVVDLALRDPLQFIRVEKVAQVLLDLAELSDEQVTALLLDRQPPGNAP